MADTAKENPTSTGANGSSERPSSAPQIATDATPTPDQAKPTGHSAKTGTLVSTGSGTDGSNASSGSSARWWLAVVVGLMVTMPLAWILSYAGMLPFFLGLFFFVLFGLLIGATMHRIAAPNRPYGRWALLIGTTLVVVAGWLGSVVKESRDFPSDIAYQAGGMTRSIGDRTITEYRAAVADEVDKYLRVHYPPGGTIGYVRWVLVSGKLHKGQIAGVNRTMIRSQRRYVWAIRVVLSIAFLGFGIGSQTLGLAPAKNDSIPIDSDNK